MERTLAAILAADMVGYSRLVERDEDSTLRRQKSLMEQVFQPNIARNGGRVVKTTGDGFLAEFNSATAAVRSALDMQRAIVQAEADTAEQDRILYRMGINLGDVIHDSGDVFGDGVNLAARLESEAEAGGIAISASVHEQITGKIDEPFTDLGERTVKNLSRPVHIYCWSQGLGRGSGIAAGRKPTVFVAPFETLGASDEAKGLAQACHDFVHASLSNHTGMRVVSRNESADFIVATTFQTASGRYRATVRLTDRLDAETFLSASFDGDASDPFAAQDDLAVHITTTVRYAVHDRVAEKSAASADTADPETLLTMAGQVMVASNWGDWEQVGGWCDRVIEAQPRNFMALSMKAIWLLREGIIGFRDVPADNAAEAAELLREALTLNSKSDFLHFAVAQYRIDVEGDLDAALRSAARGLEINPQYAFGYFIRGRARILAGDAAGGLDDCERVLPSLRQNKVYHRALAVAALGHFALGQDAQAVDYANRALQESPEFMPALIAKIAAQARMGQIDQAQSSLARARRAHPDFSRATLRTVHYADHDLLTAVLDGLNKAGLPDTG